MIKVYTTESCGFCKQIKELLTKDGVEFTEVNVNLDENVAEYTKIVEATDSDMVPMIRIGNEVLVPNVSFKSIEEAVKITKELITK